MSITKNKNKLKGKDIYIENVLTRQESDLCCSLASSNTRKRRGENNEDRL